MKKAHKIEKMEVYPVAGYDSMLLNLSGAHGPYFTRNIVILTDDQGKEGLGEVPGGEKITNMLNECKEMVIGRHVGEYKNIINEIKERYENFDDGGRGNQTFDLRTTVHVLTAIETPLLDLLGQFLEVPVASLLGDGQVRESVRFLGYLFYIGDSKKCDLDYLRDDDDSDDWGRLRREEALTPESVVKLAKAAYDRYGFKDFKLKGGVLSGKEEMKAIVAPRIAADIYDKYVAGDLEGALEAQYKLAPLRIAFGIGTFPAVIKEGLKLQGIDVGPCYEPVGPLSEEERQELKNILIELELL